MSAQIRIDRPSGRGIGVSTLGDPLSRRIVAFCHPTPGACGFDPDPALTHHWGVRVLTADRPGYGASDPWQENEDEGVREWARDLAQWLVGSLDEAEQVSSIEYRRTIGVVGWGSGGAYALELVRAMRDRVDRLALIETPSPDRLRERLRHGVLDIDIDEMPYDAGGRRVQQMLDDAYAQGAIGMEADRRALGSDEWSSDLDRIRVPTLVVARPDDAHDPTAHRSADADWWKHALPNAAIGIVRGGVPILHSWRRVLEHVAPDHGEIPPGER